MSDYQDRQLWDEDDADEAVFAAIAEEQAWRDLEDRLPALTCGGVGVNCRVAGNRIIFG